MKLSISRSRESIWVWLVWGTGIYLGLEAGPFLIAAWAFRKTAGELAGPYLAFAVPWMILAPLIWWLRKWEEQGKPPKRLARGWGLSVALFVVAVIVATLYTGVTLHLMNPVDAVVDFVVTLLMSIPISYFTAYNRTLAVISTRAADKLDNPRPK
jgi:membrane protease YdiL (CAAX protease family)